MSKHTSPLVTLLFYTPQLVIECYTTMSDARCGIPIKIEVGDETVIMSPITGEFDPQRIVYEFRRPDGCNVPLGDIADALLELDESPRWQASTT